MAKRGTLSPSITHGGWNPDTLTLIPKELVVDGAFFGPDLNPGARDPSTGAGEGDPTGPALLPGNCFG